MKNKDYPTHAYSTRRAWTVQKRKDMRKVLHAMDALRTGSAYFPDEGFSEFNQASDLLRSLANRLTVKEWGR